MKDIPKEAFWRQILALAPVYVAGFTCANSDGWLANVIYFFQNGIEVSLTPMQIATVTSSSQISRFISSIPVGILADKYGRKTMLIAYGILNFLCCAGISIDSSFITICISRFGFGIATTIHNAIIQYYVGEICSPEIRGKLTGLCQTIFSTGELLQSIIGLAFSSYYMMSYSLFGLSIVCILSLFPLMESPNYYIGVKEYEQAEVILKKVRPGYSKNEINLEFEKLKVYIDEEKKSQSDLSWIQFTKSKEIMTPLITSVLINLFSHGMGIFIISYFVTSIIPEIEFIPVIYYPFIASIIKFFVTLILPFYIEKFPRRTIFMAGAVFASLNFIITAFAGYYFYELHYEWMKWVFVFCIILSSIIMMGSTIPMVSVAKSEILPQSVKGFGGSLCGVSQALSNVLLIYLYNYLATYWGQYYVYIFFAVNSVILCVIVYYKVPEARGKFLADLQTDYKYPNDKEDNSSDKNVLI